ncbi:MAG: hypothetical protein U0V75_16025 [Ferruginibacter sp.]
MLHSIKYLIAAAIMAAPVQVVRAQKVAPVNKSPLTGISLPEGSRQDKRLLMTAAADLTIAETGKKNSVTLNKAEVLSVPLSFTTDAMSAAAKESGWNITADNNDKSIYWLEQGGKYVLAYYYASKKEVSLYFAECNQAPAGISTTQVQQQTTQQNNTPTELPPPPPQPDQQTQNQTQETITTPSPAVSSSFKFSTTNFDDGWNATEQSDWVEVTKGSIKVLLHYPKEGTVFPADPEPLTNAAWNILVAPRYSSLRNYRTAYITTYNRPYLGMGYATEIASGREMFVLLFRQGGIWIEFVTPDKNTFIQQYKFDPETIRWDSESDLMIPLANMTVYNKFAVAASDFKGKWSSDFTGIQQLYNVYTGNYAGMHVNQSNEEFVFSGNSYNWKLLVVNGMVGNSQFNQVKSSGTFSVPNNWQLQCSKIENGPKLYNAFWSCIKGARILNLLDTKYPGSGIYTQYGLAK